MFNKVILIGRTTAVPQMRYTQSGKPVCSFSIAVNRNRRSSSDSGQQDVDFIDIVAWQNLAEICAKYLDKGKLICVEGRLQVRNYTANDGSKRKAYEVIAGDMQMLSPKNAHPQDVPNSTDDGLAEETKFEQIDPSDFGMNDDLPF